MSRQAIFLDPTRRRGRFLTRLATATAVFGFAILAIFLYGVLIVPDLPLLGRINPQQLFPIKVANPAEPAHFTLKTIRAFETPSNIHPRGGHNHASSTPARHMTQRVLFRRIDPLLVAPPPVSTPAMNADEESAAPDSQEPLSIGFYDSTDASGLDALQSALPHLDWVSPAWLSVDTATKRLIPRLDEPALTLIRAAKSHVKVLPLLQNISGGTWEGQGMARLLASPEDRKALSQSLTSTLKANGFDGVVVDFESLPAGAQQDLGRFLRELKDAFSTEGLTLVVTEPFSGSSSDDALLSAASDYVLLMAYDEHGATSDPGPIASQDWYVRGLMQHMQSLNAAHTIVGLGSYAYDWTRNGAAEPLRFSDAMDAAREARAEITFDRDLLNPHFAYGESNGVRHEIWMLDAVTAYNQVLAAQVFRPAGFAVWRIGSEDPSIWPVLDHPYLGSAPVSLESIAAGNGVDYGGTGEILQITAEPKAGTREIAFDATSHVATGETYTALPSPLVIAQTGTAPGKIALTFDDGPSPDWTPKILDILKDKLVKATFFIVGVNGSASPDLVKRIVAEGHDVGNHTFTHPNLSVSPAEVLKVELNATQRLFEALTGRAMRLFRPPYMGDAHAADEQSLRILRQAQDLGYITVGLKVDPDDWQQPSPDDIVARVLAAVSDPNPDNRGQIVLLHDAGGDRKNTVDALPHLIDALRAKGFDLVPVSELAGLTQEEAMPPFPGERLLPAVNSSVFLLASWLVSALHWLAIAAIVLGLGRLAVLCTLALWGRRTSAFHLPAGARDASELSITVLIPAYNEDKVIVGSVRRILASTATSFEIIVIDDGSKDRTADCVREAFKDEPRVRLISIPNSGKAHAVNAGLRQASGDVIVALDADTQFEPETLSRLTRWFADPKVGAVAGNAKVGNRINILTRWQALEYITAQNLERRALATLGCVTVVPGAVGAWRASVLRSLGGFPPDTLAEDQDLTIAVQRAGFEVRFDSQAVAWTEAPATVAALLKQRFRWAFGTLQCLWKHHRVTFNPAFGALGMVALPQVWLFQILLSMLAPVIDLMLVGQIVRSGLDYVQHGQQLDTSDIGSTACYYGLFMVIDLAAAVIAFGFERGESWSLMLWLPLQRFGYRQLMYYVVVKAVVTALMGNLVGWGKTERQASVVVASAD